MTISRRGVRLPSLSRRNLLIGAGATAATGLLGTPAIAQARSKAVLAYGSTGYTWALPYVAEAAGLWEKANVDLTTSAFETGRDSMQALLSGSADFSASTDTPLVFAALTGLRPVAVINYSRYSRDMKIAIRKNGPVDPKKPASLKGRKIATRIGTSGQYFLAKYLELAGLKLQDVTVVDLAPNNMTTALVRGDIDGFAWVSQTLGVAQKQSNGQVEEMPLDGIEKYFQSHQLLLTTERVLKEKPDLVNTAVKVFLQAEARIASDKNWSQIIADRIKTPAGDITEATSTFTFKLTFDDRFVDDLVSQAQWAIDAGLAKPPKGELRPLLRGLVVDAPVKAAQPDRVTLT